MAGCSSTALLHTLTPALLHTSTCGTLMSGGVPTPVVGVCGWDGVGISSMELLLSRWGVMMDDGGCCLASLSCREQAWRNMGDQPHVRQLITWYTMHGQEREMELMRSSAAVVGR
uniref:Uncharacterized protein n=1 Tax=Haptolina brevifila TaxID=156173 RepID=A0A7S2ITZ7_9EUKA|mmetsp:Transcript_71551/g.141875  ORF Transcript_71551/g.141875 Transcript_71551/m.141875 type:complete len:115 (+) Transcript_71551:474-818(+)